MSEIKVGDHVRVKGEPQRKGTVYRIEPAGDGYPAIAAFKGVCNRQDCCAVTSLELVPTETFRWRKQS